MIARDADRLPLPLARARDHAIGQGVVTLALGCALLLAGTTLVEVGAAVLLAAGVIVFWGNVFLMLGWGLTDRRRWVIIAAMVVATAQAGMLTLATALLLLSPVGPPVLSPLPAAWLVSVIVMIVRLAQALGALALSRTVGFTPIMPAGPRGGADPSGRARH